MHFGTAVVVFQKSLLKADVDVEDDVFTVRAAAADTMMTNVSVTNVTN